jgi:hypothetical protein
MGLFDRMEMAEVARLDGRSDDCVLICEDVRRALDFIQAGGML